MGSELRNQLKIGDVLLTLDPTEVLRPIVAFQNKFTIFPRASRKFTHVALYVGNEKIVHSMPYLGGDKTLAGGVEEVLLGQLLTEGTTFVILRYPGLRKAHQVEIAIAARSHVGLPYDYMSILKCIGAFTLKISPIKIRSIIDLAQNAKAVFIPSTPSEPLDFARALVCGDFVNSVFDELFQHNNPCNYRGGNPAPIMMPCAFYANPNFQDVEINFPIELTPHGGPILSGEARLEAE
jgi:hypothetical protein